MNRSESRSVAVVALRQPPDVVVAEHGTAVTVADAHLLVQDLARLVPRLQQPVGAEAGLVDRAAAAGSWAPYSRSVNSRIRSVNDAVPLNFR